MEDRVRSIALAEGHYSPEAYKFLLEGLSFAIELAGRAHVVEGPQRHVTGQEVLAGLEAFARQLFGPLAAQVWRAWGVHGPLDWGRIVFVLVDHQILSRQDTDTLEDFRRPLDLDRAFVDGYRPKLPAKLP